ncbi:MAG: response regulator, partial [Oligoflexia bacterium]|nr:response regulator [Oligoflexia bacterium]
EEITESNTNPSDVKSCDNSLSIVNGEIDKVLVVDDSKVIRKVVSDNLKNKGLKVIEAKNGKEAIIKFNQFHPNIVIMDLMMPEMNGIDAMKEIRKLNENVKFIVLTSKNKNETDINSLDAVDVSSFISKSFDMNKITEEVIKISSSCNNISDINNKRILVVNNSKALSHIVNCLLTNEGFEVEEASTGVDAVEKYQEFKPILTIMDLSLPLLGGFEIMSQIREINNEAKFVILSSKSQGNDINKLLSVIKNALI